MTDLVHAPLVPWQVETSIAYHQALQRLLSEKDNSRKKKYHNMLKHVLTVAFAAGGWELLSTNLFEIANKIEKAVILFHTNRKGMAKQLLVYESRQMQVCRGNAPLNQQP